MEKWSGSGNLDWENEKTGDQVFPRREDGLVAIDFKKLCTHADKTYCCFCISRLRHVAEVAERLLHTGSLAYVSEDEALLGKYPEYLALVNAFVKKAYLTKLHLAWKVSWVKTVLGRAKGETGVSQKLLLISEYVTDSRVTDVNYIRGFRVRLGKETSEDYTKRLWDCPSSFLIDGDYLTERIPLRDMLGKSEVLLERKKEANLFSANGVKNPDEYGIGEVYADDFVGYMLPRGSRIQFIMEDVPILESHVNVEVEFDLVTYTTRGFKKKPDSA